MIDWDEEVAERLEAALHMIEEVTPWRIAHMRKDVREIHVSSEMNGFESAYKVLAISKRTLASQSTEWSATVLVHHATVARLEARGIRSQEGIELRRVRACYEAQLAFARRLPNGFEIVEHLTGEWDRGWWQSAEVERRRIDTYRRMGIPAWTARFTNWFNRER